jgi:hypothetical protein
MPIRTVRTVECDLCHAHAEHELLPKLPPPGDWLVIKVRSGTDAREKIEAVICPGCQEAIRKELPLVVQKDEQAAA